MYTLQRHGSCWVGRCPWARPLPWPSWRGSFQCPLAAPLPCALPSPPSHTLVPLLPSPAGMVLVLRGHGGSIPPTSPAPRDPLHSGLASPQVWVGDTAPERQPREDPYPQTPLSCSSGGLTPFEGPEAQGEGGLDIPGSLSSAWAFPPARVPFPVAPSHRSTWGFPEG